MINNFWSFDYTIKRFKEKAWEHTIKIPEASEYNASTKYPTIQLKSYVQNEFIRP